MTKKKERAFEFSFLFVLLVVGYLSGTYFFRNYSVNFLSVTDDVVGLAESHWHFFQIYCSIVTSLLAMCALLFALLPFRGLIEKHIYGNEDFSYDIFSKEPEWFTEFQIMNRESIRLGYRGIYQLAEKGSDEHKRKINALSSEFWEIKDEVVGHYKGQTI